MVLERTFNRLWRDEFPAGSLQQIFFAIGYVKKTVFVNAADIAGFEPVINECLAGFL